MDDLSILEVPGTYLAKMLVLKAFLPVAACTALMGIIIFQGVFHPIKVDLGFEHYGEKADHAIGPFKLPVWLELAMPLNALINAGYVLVSLLWMARTYREEKKGAVGQLHAYFAYTFCWMGVLYGPVQLWRIVSQTHESAILDQWVTLPFFTWVILWCKSLTVGWNRDLAALFMLSSLLSYNLVFFTDLGFEVALLIHAAHAFNTGFSTHVRFPCKGNNFAVSMCCLSFAIFIVFKVMDLHLPHYSQYFSEVSGHFISKLLGDVAQIHFTFLFFENIARQHLHVQVVDKSKKLK